MRRQALLLFFFSAWFLFAPSLPGKDKSKAAPSHKIAQDFSKFGEIPGAEMAGAEQCAACHADLSKGFRRSVHAMQEVSCAQCHGAGSLHLGTGGNSTALKDQTYRFLVLVP